MIALCRRLFLRLAVWGGLLAGLRFAAERFHVGRTTVGHPKFPFVARRTRRALQILIYHRVNDLCDPIFPGVPTAIFDRQMAYLAQHYRVLCLDEAIARLKSNDVPDNALAITFDDGYRDNFTDAWPILRRYQLPATIFLATDAIGTGQCLWHERVFSAFRETRVAALSGIGDGCSVYFLNSMAGRREAMSQVLKTLWALDEDSRSATVALLMQKLQVDEPSLEANLMLDWDEAASMLGHGISFGAHTMTHAILSQLSPARARAEILSSKDIIERRLGRTVNHFAYPVGRASDFDVAIKALLQEAGFASAVTTIAGSNDSTQDIFELRRATPWDEDIEAFALRLALMKFDS